MKKLFFAAAFAVVAIAGAFATNSKMAPIYYAPNSDNPVDCAPGSILCSSKTGSNVVYTESWSSGLQNDQHRVDLDEFDTAQP